MWLHHTIRIPPAHTIISMSSAHDELILTSRHNGCHYTSQCAPLNITLSVKGNLLVKSTSMLDCF